MHVLIANYFKQLGHWSCHILGTSNLTGNMQCSYSVRLGDQFASTVASQLKTTYSLHVLSCFQVNELIKAGWRLAPPPGCPKVIYELMMESWQVVIIAAFSKNNQSFPKGTKEGIKPRSKKPCPDHWPGAFSREWQQRILAPLSCTQLTHTDAHTCTSHRLAHMQTYTIYWCTSGCHGDFFPPLLNTCAGAQNQMSGLLSNSW